MQQPNYSATEPPTHQATDIFFIIFYPFTSDSDYDYDIWCRPNKCILLERVLVLLDKLKTNKNENNLINLTQHKQLKFLVAFFYLKRFNIKQ